MESQVYWINMLARSFVPRDQREMFEHLVGKHLASLYIKQCKKLPSQSDPY